MTGSKNEAKRNWLRGRTACSLRKEMKDSVRRQKKKLNRKVRHADDMPNGCHYKKLAGCAAYEYLT